MNSSVQRLVCTLYVWLNLEDLPGQAPCHDEPHPVSFRRGSFCSARLQALQTEEDPCSCRGLEQFHKAAAAMTQQLRTNYTTVNHQVAMQRQWGHLGLGPFLVVKA